MVRTRAIIVIWTDLTLSLTSSALGEFTSLLVDNQEVHRNTSDLLIILVNRPHRKADYPGRTVFGCFPHRMPTEDERGSMND